MSDAPITKIQIRSTVLRALSSLKSLGPHPQLDDIEKIVWEFSSISDKEFLAEVILKEINGADAFYDGLLANILIGVVGDACEECVWGFISKESMTDVKKLFLINLLREIGSGIATQEMANLIDNSDNLLDFETQKFLEIAKMNPEAQIDFLDFFFGVSEQDKILLLKSILEDFTGDELASILIPIIYCDKYSQAAKLSIEALKKTKSYIAFGPLEWVIKTSNDEKLTALAKKILNELKISGLRENYSELKTYKQLLYGSIPHSFWIGAVDGVSNFPCVFSRERKNGTIQTFFTVLNIEDGPQACFGFNEVAKDELDIILSRFFKNTEATQLSISDGVKILNDNIEKALKKDKVLPYELVCWSQITLDIETDKCDLATMLKSNLEKVDLGEYELKRVVKGNIVNTWFYKYGENDSFDALVNEILMLCEPKIEDFEKLFEKYSDGIFSDIINNRLLYHAYISSQAGLVNLGNILYSLTFPSGIREEFLKTILKKSIYEYFLSLKEPKVKKVTSAAFFELKKKRQDKQEQKVDVKYFLNLIEKNWIS